MIWMLNQLRRLNRQTSIRVPENAIVVMTALIVKSAVTEAVSDINVSADFYYAVIDFLWIVITEF
jgi:hypothetical protein